MNQRLRESLAARYRIEREIARGGMATVYLAEDLKHRRFVAIKVLGPSLAELLGPERFVREIETTARLQHPHILPLLDSHAEASLFYYIMPFVEGDTLRSRLEREHQLPQDDAVRLVAEVARALDHAHRRGIVHRDIKPENILLTDGEAMIADFGIAAAIHVSGGEKLTESGVTLGTPPYMSPEQITGRASVDGRSDLYSLGCVLYELLAGQPPFTGPAETLAHQHLNLAPRPIRELRPSVSEEVAAALDRVLAKVPADRFANGADFAAALDALPRAVEPVAEGAEAASKKRPGSPASGGSRRIGLAIGAIAALAIATGLVWWFQLRGRVPSVGSADRRWVWLADFDGPADDPSLAPAARDLVGASFDQSDWLATVPDDQVRIALRNSGRADTVRIDAALARELAFRSAIPLVVEGDINRIGAAYSIVLRATNAEDGHVIQSVDGQAPSERDLVPQLTRLARRLRRGLGEHPEAFRGAKSWADAPTPSFEAFKLYRLGRQLINQNRNWSALPLLRQAVAIDPEFATGWAYLGTALANLGLDDSARVARQEALRHPERLSQARRLYIEAAIADANGDAEAALADYETIIRLNPSPVDRMAALNNIGGVLSSQGEYQRALEMYLRASRTMPIESDPIYDVNEANVLIAMNRIPEARAKLEGKKMAIAVINRMEIGIIEGAWARVESLAITTPSDPTIPPFARMVSKGFHAAARAARGDFDEAQRLLEERDVSRGPRLSGLSWFQREALAEHLDRPAPGIPALIRGTSWGTAAQAIMAARSNDASGARRALAAWADSTDPSSRDAVNAYVESILDAKRGRWEPVVQRLGPFARAGVRALPTVERVLRPSLRWLMADAFEGLGQPDSAAAYLDLILAPPAYEPPNLLAVGLWGTFVRSRLVRLYANAGRMKEARRQWNMLSETCTRPDAQAQALLDDTRSLLLAAEGMRAPERK